ncbi:GNAT family N-acetyltransferase [Sulfurimonas sp.]|uniref:GNAT family N-acetyltransferase n=1 Tax=Sulfurimonas sp. TaxID=2022749 RepID=UPI0035688138
MPKPTLYFLRSSEQKITTGMLRYSMRLDQLNKSLSDFPALSIYERFYGLSSKDLGLYALVDNKIAGAVWIRLLKPEDGAMAYVDANTPVMNIAVVPEFREKGIASAMLEQFLQEAGSVFEQISVSLLEDSHAVKLFEKFGFTKVPASEGKSPLDAKDVFTMLKKLQKKEVLRPTDGYDPRRWMD